MIMENKMNMKQNTENKDAVSEVNQKSAVTVGGIQLPADYNNYSQLAKLAIQGALMLMAGKFGGGFFVKFIQDEGTAYGWLNLTIVYPDGSYKTIQLYKNYFRETDTESGNGVWGNQHSNSDKKSSKSAKGYTFVDWDGPNIEKDYDLLEAYTTPRMPIPARDLWKKILENYEDIPIVKIGQTGSVEQVLADVQAWAESNAKEKGNEFLNGDKEWYIPTAAFREIVENNGWNFSRARTEFDTLNLFVKDNSSRSYQKVKRVGDEVKRFYVIRKDLLTQASPPKLLGEIEYTTSYKTESERKIARLERQVDDYAKRHNILAEKTGDPPII